MFSRRTDARPSGRLVGAVLYVLDRWATGQRNAFVRDRTLRRLGAAGPGCQFSGSIRVSGPDKVRLGSNVHIADSAWIRGEGGVTIGDNTHISRNLVLYSVNHQWEGERLPYDETLVERGVTIGRNVWIGMNVCITPGSVIGDGAIIGMGAVVAGEIPPFTIAVSSPLRIVGQRDEARYRELDEAGAYGGASGRPLTGERPR